MLGIKGLLSNLLILVFNKKTSWFCGNCEKKFSFSKLKVNEYKELVCPHCYEYVEPV